MAEKDFSRYFLDKVKKPVEKDVSLQDYSSFRIGGKTDYFFEPTSIIEIKSSVVSAREYPLPYYLIGGGYNLLFDDDGYCGLIIRNRVKGIKMRLNEEVEVLSGTPLNELLQFLIERELAGLEFLAGIPGTIGGALFGNAGSFNQSIGDYLKEAVLLDEEGKEAKVQQDYFGFSYRQSNLREKHRILLRAVFKLRKGSKKKIEKNIEENLMIRKSKLPPEESACAGSYFKNPVMPDGTKVAAGYLLDQVGTKGLTIGQAAVHTSHANFIVNLDRASARDVLSLARELKERVKERFGIELEEEVIFLPADSSMT
jgi:UDP-N-acetylmuramate dehydrogenase